MMDVCIVIYNGLGGYRTIQKVFAKYEDAEKYIQENGGQSSEIHSYDIEVEMVN